MPNGVTYCKLNKLQPSEIPPLPEHEIRIERRAVPPAFVHIQLEDGKVQVRRALRRVSSRPDVADRLSALDRVTLLQTVGVAVLMRVVVAVLLVGVELVDGES